MPEQIFSNEPEVTVVISDEPSVELTFVDDEPTIEITQDVEARIDVIGEGLQGIPGPGLPAGGLPGQYPSKHSNVDFDLQWSYFPYVLLAPGEDPNPATTPYGALIVEMAD